MNFNYDNRCFKLVRNTNNGDANEETIFHYHQQGSIVWATYQGGDVAFGTGDIKLAQEQLRHTQMSTTSDTYVHVDRKVAERASEALAKAISPSCALTVPNATELIQ